MKMQNKISNTLFIIILFFLVKCKRDVTSPPQVIVYYSVSGSLFEILKENNYPLLNTIVPVVLDGDTVMCNSNGQFIFRNVPEGDHSLSVALPNYEFYTKKITIPIDTNITIYLVSTLKFYSVTGVVFDVVSNDYSPGLKNGAPVVLDKDTVFSDNSGKYKFNSVIEGKHIVTITLPSYEAFSTNITVNTDIFLPIYLYGIKEDYFPIQESIPIKFKYNSSYSNFVSSVQETGEAFWHIYEYKETGDIKVYNLEETVIFTRTDNYGGSSLDTSYSIFQISENNTNTISVKSGILDGISFNRYQDSRQEQEGVIYKVYNSPGSLISTITISLKKNTGISKIVQQGNRWYKTYELIQ